MDGPLCSNGVAVVVDVIVVVEVDGDEEVGEDEFDVPFPDAMVVAAVVVLGVEAPVVATVPWVELGALQVRSITGVVEDVVGAECWGSLRQMR